MVYLGTQLDPKEYYQVCSESYINPHSDGIELVLNSLKNYLSPRLLDLGCGSGLATKILSINDTLGIDSSSKIAERYERETKKVCLVQPYWEKLPKAKSAMAVYSMHLCPKSRIHQVAFQLIESGIESIVIVSPLKRALEGLPFSILKQSQAASLKANGKTVWGWALRVK